MKSINVLGMDIHCCSIREALGLTDRYLLEGPLNTILYVDAGMLMKAAENEEYTDSIQNCDLMIIDDTGVFGVLPQPLELKEDDIREEKYTRLLLKKLACGHKKIALLADSRENLKELEDNLVSYRNDFSIISKIAMEDMEESPENMINRMNDVVPDVILSRMEGFKQAKLMENSKNMINCRLWVGLPDRTVLQSRGKSLFKTIWNKVFSHSFKKEVQKYNKKEK